jgi:hypothetical protein
VAQAPPTQNLPAVLREDGLSDWEDKDWLAQTFPDLVRYLVSATDSRTLFRTLEDGLRACGFTITYDASPDFGQPGTALSADRPGIIIGERIQGSSTATRLGRWLVSLGAIPYELFLVVFVTILALGIAGLFPLPIGLLAVPVVLTGMSLWIGYFGRPQRTEIVRLSYDPASDQPTSGSSRFSANTGESRWSVIVSCGVAISHNRSLARFKSNRWLEKIERSSEAANTIRGLAMNLGLKLVANT